MPPELHEYDGEDHSLDAISSPGSEYLGAPTELADEAEAPEVVQRLVTAAAGVGLVAPLIMVGLLILSCLACVIAAWAAGPG